ncbi:hypothetical protein [Algoriphagus sp. NG3]|uniref:hypothetical protein n=1 Tax=Algoriphagus sp. NG3 TaxID=3097546 RepID=UPI002A7F74DF|nr:hypothetical protein [Algoriphagus sp. NG3]WPR73368.1 hypothetical protein SLW71_11835 [Algoriphagus sp. NG3]
MMLSFYRTLGFVGLLLIFYFFPQEIAHPIRVIHKGIDLKDPVDCTLMEVRDANNRPAHYYMNVESVVCGDSQCRVDIVKIYWDKFGRFDRLLVPVGVHLEKNEGLSFTGEDYKKLEKILKDENSPLHDLYKSEVVGSMGGEGVDALSGATILVEKSAFVEGAVWTSYSLWHWAHGATKDHIRTITSDSYTISELHSLTQSSDPYVQVFAIEALRAKKEYSLKSIEIILSAVEKDFSLLKSTLSYWKGAPNESSIYAYSQLLTEAYSPSRIIILSAILDSDLVFEPTFFENLKLPSGETTYQEIDLWLKILQKNRVVTEPIQLQLATLLDDPDFLISRRVYWFLKGQSLPSELQGRLDSYYDKWKEKL